MKRSMLSDRIYLDHNATTPLAGAVLDAMRPYLEGLVGNASSPYREGQAARRALEGARRKVADVLGAHPQEIVFTSGGSESNALALRGVLRGPHRQGGCLVVSAIEHAGVLATAEALEAEGVPVTRVPVDAEARLDEDALQRAVRGVRFPLVSVQRANNETGVLQPIGAIARRVRDWNAEAAFHTDAVQAAGKLPLDVAEMSADLLSLSAHKFHGPRGAGILYVRRGVALAPQIGGGSQERGRRSGTEDVASAVGTAEALALAERSRAESAARMAALRDRLESALADRLRPGRVRVAGAGGDRICNTSMLLFRGLNGEALVMRLDLAGLAVSVGSACSTGRADPSHVLIAMGISEDEALGSVRFSLSRETTADQIDRAVELTVGEVKAMS